MTWPTHVTECADSCKDVKLLLMLNPGVYRLKREGELGGVMYGTLTESSVQFYVGTCQILNLPPRSVTWFLIPLGGRSVIFRTFNFATFSFLNFNFVRGYIRTFNFATLSFLTFNFATFSFLTFVFVRRYISELLILLLLVF